MILLLVKDQRFKLTFHLTNHPRHAANWLTIHMASFVERWWPQLASYAFCLTKFCLVARDDDPWLSSASNCLECCSVGADLLDVSGGVDTGQRLLIFQCLAQHYGGLSEPLWTDTFTDLHVALLQLLMSGREYLVIEALQLSMLLLPSVTREELTRLLRFMHLASAPDAVSLNTTVIQCSPNDSFAQNFTTAG